MLIGLVLPQLYNVIEKVYISLNSKIVHFQYSLTVVLFSDRSLLGYSGRIYEF